MVKSTVVLTLALFVLLASAKKSEPAGPDDVMFTTGGIIATTFSWIDNIFIWLLPYDENCLHSVAWTLELFVQLIFGEWKSFANVASAAYLTSWAGVRGYECQQNIDFTTGLEGLMGMSLDGSLIKDVIDIASYEFTTFSEYSPYLYFDTLTQLFINLHYFGKEFHLWRAIAQLPRTITSVLYLFKFEFSA